MIPTFPSTKPLTLKDKPAFDQLIRPHPPYSDFNFTSLWSWDTDNSVRIAKLHHNLVIKMKDYVTRKPFYSFLGTNQVEQTTHSLIKQSLKENLRPTLNLIPHTVVKNLSPNHPLHIREDPDSHDYILSVPKIISLTGNKNRAKRNHLNRFLKIHSQTTTTKSLDLIDAQTKRHIISLFRHWQNQTTQPKQDTATELLAIKKLLSGIKHLNLHAIGVFDRDRLIAFSIDEVIHHQHGLIHYEKADTAYHGIYTYLKLQSAKLFHNLGTKFINYEQDLGIPGLKKSKSSYHPAHFLKKFTISVPTNRFSHSGNIKLYS